ncbi:MAG: hypothetical protein WCP85_21960 [Mariniphaga sp.]
MNIQSLTDLFQSLGDKQKSDYLYGLLEKDDTTRLAFIEHFKTIYEQVRIEKEVDFSFEESILSILEKAEEVSDTLGELDFEETDWDRWQGSDHYTPDYEIAQSVAEDEASEVFEDYANDLSAVLQTGNLIDIVSDFTAVFHGIKCAEINDPDNNLGDPANDYFLDILKDILSTNQKKLEARMFSTSDCRNSIELTFRFNALYYSDKKKYVKFISEIFIPTINNKTDASQVWSMKEEFNFPLNIVPKLLNKVTRLIGDKKIWIESLESSFLQDFDSSIELMEHYLATDPDKFENTASDLWIKYRDSSLEYLLDRVKKGTAFHLKILKAFVIREGNSKSLDLLKDYLSPLEIEQFIDTLANSNTKALFYASERCFDKLISLIDDNCFNHRDTYYSIRFEDAIVFLFAERPEVAWTLIKKMISNTIEKSRSRDAYAYIAKLLILSRQIVGMDGEINTLTMSCYNHRPNLSALKDEFRKAGLV